MVESKPTRPSSWLTDVERPALLDFWHVYDAAYGEVSREMMRVFEAHPKLEHVFKQTGVEGVRDESRPLVLKGIEQGDWSGYEDHIRRMAARYAEFGVALDGWYLLTHALADVVIPRLVDSFAADPPRLKAALHAMRTFIDQVRVLLATEFMGVKENALRESSALNTAILDAATDAIVTVDHTGRIVEFNPAAERIFGYARSRALGSKLEELIVPPALRARHVASFTRAVETGEAKMLGKRIELAGYRADGTEFPAEIVITRISRDGPPMFTAFVSDVSVRNQTHQALADSEQRLRALAARLQEVIEEERTRIAREMHDELGQQLTALKLDLGWMLRRYETRNREGFAERLHASIALVDQTVQTVRRLATRLRPGALDDLGLVAALDWEAREVATRSGIHFEIALPEEEELHLTNEQATALFRTFQEILTNVMRHAGAKNVRVRLERTEREITLEVDDDGRGITSAQASSGKSLGLLGIRERVALLGGTFAIGGAPEGGTGVKIVFPLG
jgi:two-component system sensor kinase